MLLGVYLLWPHFCSLFLRSPYSAPQPPHPASLAAQTLASPHRPAAASFPFPVLPPPLSSDRFPKRFARAQPSRGRFKRLHLRHRLRARPPVPAEQREKRANAEARAGDDRLWAIPRSAPAQHHTPPGTTRPGEPRNAPAGAREENAEISAVPELSPGHDSAGAALGERLSTTPQRATTASPERPKSAPPLPPTPQHLQLLSRDRGWL